MEDLEHPGDLPFRNKRRHECGDESFFLHEVPADEIHILGEIGNGDRAAIQHGAPGVALPEPQPVRHDGVPAESSPGAVIQLLGMWINEQYVRRVRVELGNDLIQDDGECEAKVQTPGDGLVNRAQRLRVPQSPLCVLALLALGLPRLPQLSFSPLQGRGHAVECAGQSSEFPDIMREAAPDGEFPAPESLGGHDEPVHWIE